MLGAVVDLLIEVGGTAYTGQLRRVSETQPAAVRASAAGSAQEWDDVGRTEHRDELRATCASCASPASRRTVDQPRCWRGEDRCGEGCAARGSAVRLDAAVSAWRSSSRIDRPAERLATSRADWDAGGGNNGGRALPASVGVRPASPSGAVGAAAAAALLCIWALSRRVPVRASSTVVTSRTCANH